MTSATAAHVTDPLTTIFTPPAWCSEVLYTYSSQSDGTSVFWKNANGPPGTGSGSSCYPPYFSDHHNAPPGSGTGEYSPAVCPTNYVVALAETGSAGVATSFCCPSGFTASSGGQGCFSRVHSLTVVAENAFTNASISTDFLAADWIVRVLWRTVDLDLFTPKSAPLLQAAQVTVSGTDYLPASTSGPNPPSTATSATETGSGSSSGFSTGAKAGIGVGVGSGVIVLIIVGLFLFRYQRRTRSLNGLDITTEKAKAVHSPSQVTEPQSPERNPEQLDSNPIHEAEADKPISELESGPTAELEGSEAA